MSFTFVCSALGPIVGLQIAQRHLSYIEKLKILLPRFMLQWIKNSKLIPLLMQSTQGTGAILDDIFIRFILLFVNLSIQLLVLLIHRDNIGSNFKK